MAGPVGRDVLGTQAGWLMLMRATSRESGFTLIELAITLVVLGILISAALPTYSEYMTNARVRSAAEGVLNGLQTARVEALKRNAAVVFSLTSDAPADSVTPEATGRNWVVRITTDGGATYKLLTSSTGESGANTNSTLSYGATAKNITFSPVGLATPSETAGTGTGAPTGGAAFNFSDSAGGSCKPSGNVRCLRIVVTNGGDARMCDPSISTTGDSRKC